MKSKPKKGEQIPPSLYNIMRNLFKPIEFENPFKKARIMLDEVEPLHQYPNLGTMMRVIKIHSIESSFDSPKIDETDLKFLKRILSEDDILTGSMAISLFFNLGREAKDIDIISSNPKRWGKLIKTSYPEEPENYIGSTYRTKSRGIFKNSVDYKIDIFSYPCNWIDFCGIKIHNPPSILEIKSEIYKNSKYKNITAIEKHYYDIYQIYKNIQ